MKRKDTYRPYRKKRTNEEERLELEETKRILEFRIANKLDILISDYVRPEDYLARITEQLKTWNQYD